MPARAISRIDTRSVPNTIALGGVATGNINAHEHDKVAGIISNKGFGVYSNGQRCQNREKHFCGRGVRCQFGQKVINHAQATDQEQRIVRCPNFPTAARHQSDKPDEINPLASANHRRSATRYAKANCSRLPIHHARARAISRRNDEQDQGHRHGDRSIGHQLGGFKKLRPAPVQGPIANLNRAARQPKKCQQYKIGQHDFFRQTTSAPTRRIASAPQSSRCPRRARGCQTPRTARPMHKGASRTTRATQTQPSRKRNLGCLGKMDG